ncbi:MAG: hypothetical protein ACTSYA_13300 [Candidatus Kariarchaeaceae archaeon]
MPTEKVSDQEFFVGRQLTNFLIEDLLKDPALIVRAYETLLKSIPALDETISSLESDKLERVAMMTKSGILDPLIIIKKACDLHKKGELYDVSGTATALAVVNLTHDHYTSFY